MRLRSLQFLCAGALALLIWVPPAAAGPVDDVIRGNGLYLNGVSVTLDGAPYSTSGYTLAKAPGSLEMVLNGRDFGLGADLPVHLHGAVSGNNITWTFNEHLATPYAVPPLYSVTDVQGAIVVKATNLPGELATRCSGSPCPYNVALVNAPGTWIRVRLSGLTDLVKEVNVTWLQLLAGLPRPALAYWSVRTPTRLCTAGVDSYLTGQVSLTSIAPTGGTWVDISSSDSSAIRVIGVRVPAGERFAPVRLVVRAGFVGSVLVTAASNGVTATSRIDVRPESDCQHIWFSIEYTRALIPRSLVNCNACTLGIDFNSDGAALARVSGIPTVYSPPSSLVNLNSFFGGAKDVNPIRLNAFGAFTGTLADVQGNSRSFYVRAGDRRVFDLGTLTPMAVNDLGVVVGSRPGATGPVASYFNGVTIVDLKMGTPWSQAVALNNAGTIVGTYGNNGHTRSFLSTPSSIIDLGSFGGDMLAAGINETGTVALSGMTTNGTWVASIYSAKTGLKPLGGLNGFINTQARAINRASWVVGTADDGKGTSHGFLYTPGNGLIDLNQIVDPQSGVEVVEALGLTDNGDVLVRGRTGGVIDTYVLHP